MKNQYLIIITLVLTGCYSIPVLERFETEKWEKELTSCEENKIALAQIVVDQKEKLLGEGQAEIKTLLGQPKEHELYNRNQKFFFYDLTAGDSCNVQKKRLSVRFDALDRVKDVRIIIDQNETKE